MTSETEPLPSGSPAHPGAGEPPSASTDEITELDAATTSDESTDSAGATSAEAGEQPGRPAGRLKYIALGAALALAVVALAAAPVAFVRRADREPEIQEVATRFVKNLVSFDHRTLEADIARIEADATGDFRGELETLLGGDVALFRDTLVKAEAHSEGTVHAVVVESVDGERAVVDAFVTQRITNKENPDPQGLLRHIRLSLVETSRGWKVSGVETPED